MNDILYHTKFLDLKSITSKNGNPWFYAHRPNAKDVIVILPVYEDEILFLIEERPPIQAENKGKYTIGTVAGLVGDVRIGEAIEEAITTELLEETGLVADKVSIKTNIVASSAGCVSETFAIAIANIKDRTLIQPPIDDGGIIIDRVWIKRENIRQWLKDKEEQGYVLTSQVLSALFYLYE